MWFHPQVWSGQIGLGVAQAVQAVEVRRETMDEAPQVQLLGGEHSYFSGKARAYLRWKQVPHELVTASMEVYGRVILPTVGWSVIPVVVDEGEVVQDTALIIDHFERKMPLFRPVVPPAHCGRRRAASALLELFGDDFLVLAAMHYRWSFPEQRDYLRHEFERLANPEGHAHATAEDRAASLRATEKIMAKFAGFLPALGVTKESIPGIEASYARFLAAFERHLQQTRYLLCDAPCVGDFGLFGPLYAHLYKDPVPGREMKLRAPYVAEWVERVNGASYPGAERPQHVDDTGRVVLGQHLELGAEDNIPASLLPLLQQCFDEHVPMLVEVMHAAARFKAETRDEGKELPRVLGWGEFVVGGKTVRKMLPAFLVWKTQRVLDQLTSDARQFVAQFGPNAQALLALDPHACRVAKRVGVPNRASTIFFAEHVSGAQARL